MPRPKALNLSREDLWNVLIDYDADLAAVRTFLGVSKPTLYREMADRGISARAVRSKLERDRIAAINGRNIQAVQNSLSALAQALQEFQGCLDAVFGQTDKSITPWKAMNDETVKKET